ncbi:MAG: FGGY-family carbohydrate kinase, partial [Chloroflexota bacterium]|nr:FGGY-family carbohydrate kinase [Chloroflexota bacterium]
LWRQLQADIYRTPIVRTSADEGPAYGAALLGGVAAGAFRDVEEACSRIQLRAEVTQPDPGRSDLYDRYYELYRSLYPATRTAMRQLTELAGT